MVPKASFIITFTSTVAMNNATRFLLGVVRKQLGLAFDGESWPYPMIIGDLEIKGVDGKVSGAIYTLRCSP